MLFVTRQSGLKVQSLRLVKRSHQGIIEVERLTRVNASAFLGSVKFIHLEGGGNDRPSRH